MMKFTGMIAVSVILGLGACGRSNDEFSNIGRFGTVSGDSLRESDHKRENQSLRNSVGRAVYSVEPRSGSRVGFQAIAGYDVRPKVGRVVTSGKASYDTRYSYKVVHDIKVSGGTLAGDTEERSGRMELKANFDSGELTGRSKDLDVDAAINGKVFGGTATASYRKGLRGRDVDGLIKGEIGASGVIGAFQGNSSNAVVAGGLVGKRN